MSKINRERIGKNCGRCKQFKLNADFRKKKQSWDGLDSYCKSCGTEYEAFRLRKALYNMEREEYDALFSKQNGKCASCGGINSNGRSLGVDHDHITGEIRALLCGNCNAALGFLKDNPNLVAALLKYILEFKELD
jgi:RNase P subunit RPR2